MPTPFAVRDQDDPTRDLGEWTEDGSIRLPGSLTVAGGLTVGGVRIASAYEYAEYVFEAPAGAVTRVLFPAPANLTITKVQGLRNGGTGATINATNNGSDIGATDLSLTTADTFLDVPNLQNVAVVTGSKIALAVRSVAGSPAYVTVRLEYRVS